MLKSLLLKFAPTLALAVGGPFAGAATKAVLTALDLKPDATDSEIADVLATADPAVLQKLRDANHRFEVRMAELEISRQTLEFKDRDSARKLAAANGGLIQAVIAVVILTGYAAFLFAVFTRPLADNDIALVAYGTLANAVGLVLGFYFGTTKSSAEKNAIIAAQSENRP